MQQRQLRLGDILDDYCPRERRVTNHAVVAMLDDAVKQTRCTTCDAEHEYKHAKVPRQRRKSETPAALYSQVLAGGPKRIVHESQPAEEPVENELAPDAVSVPVEEPAAPQPEAVATASDVDAPPGVPPETTDEGDEERESEREGGPVHRPLIRASLPRLDGQPPPTRPAPEFTIRQPGGRQNRFRPRHGRGPQQFHGNRGNGNMGGGPMRGGSGMPRQSGGRPPHGTMTSRLARREGPGRKRSK